MPDWWDSAKDWTNADRASVIVAALALLASVAAVIVSVVYGGRQARIATAAKDEARRSADAAEKQATIAAEAKEAARRSADVATEMAKLEARRDHFTMAAADVELLRVESRPHVRNLPHRELWVVLKNNGPRVYRYWLNVEFSTKNRTTVRTGNIHAGETLDLFFLRDGIRYGGIEVLLDGECPCQRPDDERAHWRKFWPAPIHVAPEDEPPSIF